MQKKYDADKILAANTLSNVIGARVELKPSGREFRGCCPFHKEKTPSFSVVDHKKYGFYHCFGCGASGNAINFIQNFHGVGFQEACQILGGELESPENMPTQQILKEAPDIYDGLEIIPLDIKKHGAPPKAGKWFSAYNPKSVGDETKKTNPNYKPSMVFNYSGLFWVIRIDISSGRKITPVVAVVRNKEGDEFWSHIPAPEPRPLYQLHRIETAKQVVLVEGEKACDAANKIMQNNKVLEAITWCGGGKAWQKTDWIPLSGKSVVIWPDADEPGIATAAAIGEHLRGIGCNVKIVNVPDNENGWDAADALREGWTLETFIDWAKRNTIQPEPEPKPEKKPEPEPKPTERLEPEPEAEEYEEVHATTFLEYDATQSNEGDDDKFEHPFRMLGYNRNECYYLPDNSQQVYALSPNGHSKNNFLWLAPMDYWERIYPSKKGPDWEMAANSLMRSSQRAGVFDPCEQLRGRGAWLDEGRSIMHLGRTVYCEGRETDPRKIESKYVYEIMPDLGVRITKTPATTPEAIMLVKICAKLSWQNDLSAALLAGWCIVAPVSGILRWRPHIWLTGPSGSGKSTVVYKIIGAVLGKMAVHVEGKTTEAGIRQQLMQDARPIIYDEAEGEDEVSARRLQGIIDLARVASSGGRVMKGSNTGISQSYSVRSCFCFSSINTSVKHFADETRISKLVLAKDKRPNAEAYYNDLHGEILDTFTPEYSAKMLTRSLDNLETLQANSEIFSRVAARIFKSSRVADQLGEMLAGYYLCHSTKIIEYADAEAWIKKQDWAEMTSADEKSDPERLLDRICTYSIRLTSNHEMRNTTLGELILSAAKVSEEINENVAQSELKRWGIKVEFTDVIIANKSDPLANRVLKDSPWATSWARPLRELPGAEALAIEHFTAGIKSRATKIPLTLFTG